MLKICIILFFLVIGSACKLLGQGGSLDYPKVGELCPDYTFNQVVDFPSGKHKISDFKSKWLILDFWSTWCSTCIKSFPKMNELQNYFKNDVQIVMVGYNGGRDKNRIGQMYDLLKKRHALNLPVTFDSILFEQFAVGGVPCIVIIDPNGIVRSYTSSVDSLQISNLLTSKNVQFDGYLGRNYEPKPWDSYRKNELLLTNDNGGNDTAFIYRSLITKWTPEMPVYSSHGLDNEYYKNYDYSIRQKGVFEAIGMTSVELYRIAYFGRAGGWRLIEDSNLHGNTSENIVFMNKDSLIFQEQFYTKKNLYSYSLKVPQEFGKNEYLQQKMKNDFDAFFNIKTSLEKIVVKELRLVVIDTSKFQACISKNYDAIPITIANEIPRTGFKFRNRTSDEIVKTLLFYLMNGGYEFISNEVVNNVRLDIDFSCSLDDFDDVKKAFERHGIGLINDSRIVNSIVVRDIESLVSH